MGILVGVLIGGTGGAGPHNAHHGVGLGEHALFGFIVVFGSGHQVVQCQADVVEVQFALGQGTLAHLVQRCAAADTLTVQRHQNHASLVFTRAVVVTTEEDAGLGNRTIGDPGGLLSANHNALTLDLRVTVQTTMCCSWMTRMAAAVEHVGAVVRVGDAPAAQWTIGIAVNQVIAAENVKD
ncbi:hypothetical protein D3C86_1746960 [compost metagenome]